MFVCIEFVITKRMVEIDEENLAFSLPKINIFDSINRLLEFRRKLNGNLSLRIIHGKMRERKMTRSRREEDDRIEVCVNVIVC